MRRDPKKAVMQRLAFAVAELELAAEIAKCEGDPFLLGQLPTLPERVRDCITFMSDGAASQSLERRTFLGV